MEVNKLLKTAKIINSGDIQLIPVPREYHFDCEEVVFNRFGYMTTVTPVDKVTEVFDAGVGGITEDFVQALESLEEEFRVPEDS